MKPYFQHPTAIVAPQAKIGRGTKIWAFAQIRENALIGKNCILGLGVYVDANVRIGNKVKIQNNASIYQGVEIEDGVFIGPHVCLVNDKTPRALNKKGGLKTSADWKRGKIVIKKGASIGANTTVLPDITIGEYAMIGAESVVTRDIPAYSLAYGNPARVKGKVDKQGNVS